MLALRWLDMISRVARWPRKWRNRPFCVYTGKLRTQAQDGRIIRYLHEQGREKADDGDEDDSYDRARSFRG